MKVGFEKMYNLFVIFCYFFYRASYLLSKEETFKLWELS